MQKKTILHFITSLERGGAETMLVQVLKELKDYTNIVVTLHNENHFEGELVCDKYICLQRPAFRALPFTALKFHALVKKYKPDLVHSHLVLPNFIARLATPSNIPLVTTIHTCVSQAPDYKKRYLRFLDRFTYQIKKSTIIAVSETVMNDYFSFLKLKPASRFVVHTFVNEKKFSNSPLREHDQFAKLVSVGALRIPKNYLYLIKAFQAIKSQKIQLDIYGAGPHQKTLQSAINDSGVNINLKGQIHNIPDELSQYDVFVMPSLFEGFSLSVLEAMAAKLPLLLSDIPSFREQAAENAIYFDLNNVDDFIEKLNVLLQNKELRKQKAASAYQRMTDHFTLTHHLEKLHLIYDDLLQNKQPI